MWVLLHADYRKGETVAGCQGEPKGGILPNTGSAKIGGETLTRRRRTGKKGTKLRED